jgi:threonylcarbamoyladenosine tRNA methylthiotransferase MtaB
MFESGKLCRHLHIPIQSGDDEILKKMKRKYSRRDYISLIKKIKSFIPGIAITTDVLVGFPGEKEENFQNSLDLVEQILPLRVHIFPYSPREHTPAYNFIDNIRPEIVKKRISRLQKLAKKCSRKYMKQFLGKKMHVLIEDKAKKQACFWEGYTDNYIKTLIYAGNDLRNQLICVKFKRITKDHMI